MLTSPCLTADKTQSALYRPLTSGISSFPIICKVAKYTNFRIDTIFYKSNLDATLVLLLSFKLDLSDHWTIFYRKMLVFSSSLNSTNRFSNVLRKSCSEHSCCFAILQSSFESLNFLSSRQ